MKIFIFGNEDLDFDSTPLRILPELKKRFSTLEFEVKDPNEEWDIPDNLIIIDTILGIKDITVFKNLQGFEKAPRLTMHDFDAYANLLLLKKLGKIKNIMIIGVPSEIDNAEALKKIENIIREKIKTP